MTENEKNTTERVQSYMVVMETMVAINMALLIANDPKLEGQIKQSLRELSRSKGQSFEGLRIAQFLDSVETLLREWRNPSAG